MKDLDKLKPFNKFCCSIGYIPSSYKVAMSYEEQLLWFCDFLQNQVIPTVNINAEAVEELQNYVSHYFDNLDVQTEIDNKLDDMAEQGQLTELITDYLNLKCILAFDTVYDMTQATNLIEGSYVKTYGEDTLNDGFGQFYFVREIINTDVVDGYNKIALNDQNLIAVRVYDKINDSLCDTIIMGDSYALGQGPSPLNYGWASLLKQKLKLDNSNSYIIAEGGDGFVDDTPHTFLQLLQENMNSITHKERIKNLIIAGGYNDKEYTYNEILSAIVDFSSYVETYFPNCTIYLGHIAWNTGINGDLRKKLIDNSLRAYSNSVSSCNNVVYLNGVEFSLVDRTLTQSDYIHPNANGIAKITENIYQAFKTGSCTFYSETITTTMTASNSPTSGSLVLEEKVLNNVLKINLTNVDLRYEEDISFIPISGAISLGTISTRYLQPIKDTITVIPVASWITNSNGGYGGGPAELLIGPTGEVKLFPFYVDTSGSEISSYNRIRILATSHTFPMLYN